MQQKELTVDQKFLDQLTAEAEMYIFDSAKIEVQDAITNTEDTPQALAATTYKVVKGLMEKHKKVGLSLEADMSHALALGTEVTDMLVETIQAMQPDAIIDADKLREETLLRATAMHGEDMEKIGDPEAREEAQVMYAGMMQDGTVDQAMGYVNSRAKDLGLNTNDMMRKGTEMGKKWGEEQVAAKDPLADGIKKGLHNMSTGPAPPADPAAAPPMEQVAETPPQAGPEGAVMGGPPPADPMAAEPMAAEPPPPEAPLMGVV